MSKAKPNKRVRDQQRERAAGLAARRRSGMIVKSELHESLGRAGSTRSPRDIAIWLAQAVWRQQADMNCLDATHTLSAALDLFGIKNRIVPVAVVADDIVNERRVASGQTAVDFVRRAGGLPDDAQPARVEDAAEFWVEGGHAVVMCDDLDLILDATVDQFGIQGIRWLFAPLSQGLFEEEGFWQYTFGGTGEDPKATLTYIEVGDVIEMDEGPVAIMSVAARELASVGLIVDFDPAVVGAGNHVLYPSFTFLDKISGELDRGDFSSLERFRAARTLALATLGHFTPVPDSWALAPRSEGL